MPLNNRGQPLLDGRPYRSRQIAMSYERHPDSLRRLRMARSDVMTRLANGERLLMDGAMGSLELHRRGVEVARGSDSGNFQYLPLSGPTRRLSCGTRRPLRWPERRTCRGRDAGPRRRPGRRRPLRSRQLGARPVPHRHRGLARRPPAPPDGGRWCHSTTGDSLF